MLRDSRFAFYLEFYVNEECCDQQMLGDLLLTKRFSFLFLCFCSCSCNHYINFRILHLHTNFNAHRKLRNLRKIEKSKNRKSTNRIEKSMNRVESRNRRIGLDVDRIDVRAFARSIVSRRSSIDVRVSTYRDSHENMTRLHSQTSYQA